MTGEKVTTTHVPDKTVRDIKEKGGRGASRYSGVGNKNLRELTTHFASTEAESVIRGSSNSFIILGKDRNAGEDSGYGGIGASGASCIDLFAGHMGSRPFGDINGVKIPADKDFINDASRVYISQLADVDDYFQIPKVQMKMGNQFLDIEASKMLSTVAAKADTIRLIGRENIKIVTFHRGLNSRNKESYDGGIDIVAGCNVAPYDKTLSLQPMVKGENLLSLFRTIITIIENIQSTTNAFIMQQIDFNAAISKHVHQSGAAGMPSSQMLDSGTKSINFQLLKDIVPKIISDKVEIRTATEEYLRPLNDKYINSVWNRVN